MPGQERFFLVVAVGLAAIGALSAAPGDEAEVRAFMQAFSERWVDAEDVTSFFAADATLIGAESDWGRRPEGLAGRGRLDVRSVSFLAERVALVGGDIAPSGGPGAERAPSERFSFVLKKTGAGWKIAGSGVTLAGSR